MRTKTIASLLILCGSTAAFANIANTPAGQTTANNTVEENTTVPTEPTTPTEPAPTDTPPANTTETTPPQF